MLDTEGREAAAWLPPLDTHCVTCQPRGPLSPGCLSPSVAGPEALRVEALTSPLWVPIPIQADGLSGPCLQQKGGPRLVQVVGINPCMGWSVILTHCHVYPVPVRLASVSCFAFLSLRIVAYPDPLVWTMLYVCKSHFLGLELWALCPMPLAMISAAMFYSWVSPPWACTWGRWSTRPPVSSHEAVLHCGPPVQRTALQQNESIWSTFTHSWPAPHLYQLWTEASSQMLKRNWSGHCPSVFSITPPPTLTSFHKKWKGRNLARLLWKIWPTYERAQISSPMAHGRYIRDSSKGQRRKFPLLFSMSLSKKL